MVKSLAINKLIAYNTFIYTRKLLDTFLVTMASSVAPSIKSRLSAVDDLEE